MDIFSSALHDTNHHNALNDRRQRSRRRYEAQNDHHDGSDDHPNMHREDLFLKLNESGICLIKVNKFLKLPNNLSIIEFFPL